MSRSHRFREPRGLRRPLCGWWVRRLIWFPDTSFVAAGSDMHLAEVDLVFENGEKRYARKTVLITENHDRFLCSWIVGESTLNIEKGIQGRGNGRPTMYSKLRGTLNVVASGSSNSLSKHAQRGRYGLHGSPKERAQTDWMI